MSNPILLAGAGSSNSNGTLNPIGIIDGKEAYSTGNDPDNDFTVRWHSSDNAWYIFPAGAGGDPSYSSTNNTTYPYQATFTVSGLDTGILPAPTVTELISKPTPLCPAWL